MYTGAWEPSWAIFSLLWPTICVYQTCLQVERITSNLADSPRLSFCCICWTAVIQKKKARNLCTCIQTHTFNISNYTQLVAGCRKGCKTIYAGYWCYRRSVVRNCFIQQLLVVVWLGLGWVFVDCFNLLIIIYQVTYSMAVIFLPSYVYVYDSAPAICIYTSSMHKNN